MNAKMISGCVLWALLVLIAGCGGQVRTPYQRPALEVPTGWQQQTEAAGRLPDAWWHAFGDDRLNHLVEEALARNINLASAALQVRKARLQAEQAASDRLPEVSVQGSAGISRALGDDDRGETRDFSVFGAISYEVDLFDRLGSQLDAARWEAEATEEDRIAVALALTGDTASNYLRLAYLNQRLTTAQASIDHARRTLELVAVQQAAGAASTLEVLEARRSLAAQEANRAILLQQRTETRHSLALLFDGPPRQVLAEEPQSLGRFELPPVEAGLPAELLARRPDLLAAEARLRAALAGTDAARAALYPRISLTGSLGQSSEDLKRLLDNPVAALTVDLALPFVQWRDRRRDLALAQTDAEQAVLDFRQGLYSALAEVENALSARRQLRRQEEQLILALESAQGVETRYQVRYRAGGSPLKAWLDAQEDRRQAEIALTENRLEQLDNHIVLVKAMGGGGWKRAGDVQDRAGASE